jgi:hypothetical protein
MFYEYLTERLQLLCGNGIPLSENEQFLSLRRVMMRAALTHIPSHGVGVAVTWGASIEI